MAMHTGMQGWCIMPGRRGVPLLEVVAGGDHRASLEALRDTLAVALTGAESANVASLAKQLQAVLRELAELPPPVTETNPVDDLNAKRAARRAAASSGGPPGGGGVKRGGGGGRAGGRRGSAAG